MRLLWLHNPTAQVDVIFQDHGKQDVANSFLSRFTIEGGDCFDSLFVGKPNDSPLSIGEQRLEFDKRVMKAHGLNPDRIVNMVEVADPT